MYLCRMCEECLWHMHRVSQNQNFAPPMMLGEIGSFFPRNRPSGKLRKMHFSTLQLKGSDEPLPNVLGMSLAHAPSVPKAKFCHSYDSARNWTVFSEKQAQKLIKKKRFSTAQLKKSCTSAKYVENVSGSCTECLETKIWHL